MAKKSTPKYQKIVGKANVGPNHLGFFNLKQNKKDASGKYTNTPGALPISVEAWRWPSLRAYHKQSLNGQLTKFSKDVESWVEHLGRNSHVIINNSLIPTFEKSKIYCPKVTLLLVQSGRLKVDYIKNTNGSGEKKARVSISYGSKLIPFYAVYVHEILSYNHEAPTRAKFLESAINEDRNSITEYIKQTAKTIIGV
jgi:hypothetical protein